MDAITKNSLPPMLACFSRLQDPRVMGRCKYYCEEIIALTMCAIVAGARHWTQVERFGLVHKKWLDKFMNFTNGIPSHYTIGRFWSKVSPQNFLYCFQDWVKQSAKKTKGKIIALDGKTSRATYNNRKGIKPVHIVNAFDTCSNIILGQERVLDKTNEIKAIPTLLKKLELTGCLVTIDAMGCQRGIAKLIKNRGGDYVFAVKLNQGKLYKKLRYLFSTADKLEYNAMIFRKCETKEYEHGRIEERKYTVLPECYDYKFREQWQGLESFIEVKRTRIVGDEVSESIHYYISSIEMRAHMQICKAIRYHWQIENNCHWILDNTFQEDRCTVRRGFGSENFSLIKKFVLNLLRLKRRGKCSFEAMRLEAAWDKRYLTRLVM